MALGLWCRVVWCAVVCVAVDCLRCGGVVCGVLCGGGRFRKAALLVVGLGCVMMCARVVSLVLVVPVLRICGFAVVMVARIVAAIGEEGLGGMHVACMRRLNGLMIHIIHLGEKWYFRV